MTSRTPARFATALLLGSALLFGSAPEARAHLATFGSWEITRDYLGELFPDAKRFKVKSHEFSAAEVAKLEEKLGFALYPEDRTPSFYIAIGERSGKPVVLGVAIFIDPRIKSQNLDKTVVRLEVGIAVNAKGQIHRVAVFDYRGDLALTKPAFLQQLNGRSLRESFLMGSEGLNAVSGEELESQLVANAAREALLLMKVALGK